jgi:hypothetical protein
VDTSTAPVDATCGARRKHAVTWSALVAAVATVLLPSGLHGAGQNVCRRDSPACRSSLQIRACHALRVCDLAAAAEFSNLLITRVARSKCRSCIGSVASARCDTTSKKLGIAGGTR